MPGYFRHISSSRLAQPIFCLLLSYLEPLKALKGKIAARLSKYEYFFIRIRKIIQTQSIDYQSIFGFVILISF